ncbi:MAG: PAS domain-containing protein [Alphaproteobacteria bacterium]|nr:PAS domain-containing protein [Alphaproteobacteria bacterium]
MWHHFKPTIRIDRNSSFSTRVIVTSVPTAVLLAYLVINGQAEPWFAIVSYIITLLLTGVFLFPISSELFSLRRYIYELSNGQNVDLKNLNLSDQDTKKLADAINSFHRFWISKTDTLEARAMSDAAVFDTLPDPIIMIDSEGNITGANRSARDSLGEDIISKRIDALFPTNIFVASVEKILKNNSDSESLVFHTPDHNNQQLYAHITRLNDNSKGRAAAVISLYNISKAITLEKMQSDFVANASHELRTPLSVIAGFIETLQTSAHDDSEARDMFLGIMKEQTEYMSSLIEDLLSLSRLEMAQNQELKDKVDINEVVDDVVKALQFKAFNRSISVKISQINRLPKIVGDNQQIHQILQNIVDNAIKYAPENSEITIELKTVPEIPSRPGQNVAEGRAVSIAVNNKGLKIKKEDLARLTEKFYRMQIHKDMKIRGTGLGLTIAKQIVLHHRGNLTVTSTSYNGNTFTIYLPVKQK